MESVFRTWKTSRELYLDYFNNYTLEQLNKIPNGFSNNLIWNIGHIIVAQQALIYKDSDLEGYIPNELFELYKPGTKPTGKTSQNEVTELKELLLSLIKKTETDFYDGKFVNYNERMTGTGFYLTSLKDAFEFNNYHEGLHLGFMVNIKKFI
ncbi:DinB family protein [Aquimarina algiphila]|uniref:DinB family protein n=1 Tax=Aquimarina algiphila TaxID=2047982 RepID=A0A554VAE0_9FLAO|nr:DinB family protein [Aquimarina algiphila]TSE03001.1 DinB family protein [Aquimarina algiphila]